MTVPLRALQKLEAPRLKAAVIALLLMAAAPVSLAGETPPSRPGTEVVNPFVTPFSYSPAGQGVAAYERVGLPPNASVASLGAAASSVDQLAFSLSDDSRFVTSLANSEGQLDVQSFVFAVAPEVAEASSIVFSWEGYGEYQPGYPTKLYAFNHASQAWDELASKDFVTPQDGLIAGEIASGGVNYIAGGNITVAVASQKGRLATSCPMLYVWEGSTYRFVSDFLAGGTIGMPIGVPENRTLIRFPADDTEWVRLGTGGEVAARDGQIVVQVVEQLEEVTYLDGLSLAAVDHPAGTQANPEESARYFAPFPSGEMLVYSGARHPVAAWDDRGNDVLALISSHDRRYPPVPLTALKEGFAYPHDLYLDLGPFAQDSPVHLLVDAWIRFTINDADDFAANRIGWYDSAPRLAVSDGAGGWIEVSGNAGLPAGLPKTYVENLTGRFPTGNHTVRLSSTSQVYFDEVRVATDAGAWPFSISTAQPAAADLHSFGFPIFRSFDGRAPSLPVYEDVSEASPWAVAGGNYTRFGEVVELLGLHDDRFVVMGPGDELTVRFSAAEFGEVPAGMVRTYFLLADGYFKDRHPSVPQTLEVDPLPYHEMPAYPYGAQGSFPDDELHRAYIAQFQTRYRAPQGPAGGHASVQTDFVALEALLPARVADLSVPLLLNSTVFERVTYRGGAVYAGGNVTIGAGGTLTLDHTQLFMNGSGGRIRVEAGGSLRLLNGSSIDDSPFDVDDGSGSDFHYFVEALDGSEVWMDRASVRRAGDRSLGASAQGLFIEGASVFFDHVTIEGAAGALTLSGVRGPSVRNLALINSSGVDLTLVNASRLEAFGLEYADLAISVDSLLIVRTAITVDVRDGSGKPMRGVDLRMTDNGRVQYASAGFGGPDAPTGRVLDFDDGPLANIIYAVGGYFLGSSTPTMNITELSLRYFGWNQTRTINATRPHAEQFTVAGGPAAFANRAASAGFDTMPRNNSAWDSHGPGVAAADYDADGDIDLFATGATTRGELEAQSTSPNRLYRNAGNGTFEEVTGPAGLSSDGSTGAAWGDFNNDGYPDLYLVNHGLVGPTLDAPGAADRLFRNNRDGSFTDVTAQAGVLDDAHGASAAWGDVDADGWLDLYVGNYGWSQGWHVRNESNILYRNNRDGTFSDVTDAWRAWGGGPQRRGVVQDLIFLNGDNATPLARDSPNGSGFTTAVAWLDYDRDGKLDLFVGNDFGVCVLYHNDGATFSVATQAAGLQKVGSARGVAVVDLDGDGLLDVYQANRWVDFAWRNKGDGTFEDMAAQWGLDNELPGTAVSALDFDLDGDADVFVGGAGLTSYHTFAPAFLWRNGGADGFEDVTAAAGVAQVGARALGAAAADFNGDGRPDVAVANGDRPNALFMNVESGGHYLGVRLNGTASPRDGQGAVVELRAPGAAHGQVQQVGAVGARGSQSSLGLTFGVAGTPPSAGSPWHLTVHWPSGITQELAVDGADALLQVDERASFEIQPIGPLRFAQDDRFELSASIRSNDPLGAHGANFTWRLQGPQPVLLHGQRLNFSLHAIGTYQVTLEVSDRTGTQRSLTFDLQIMDTAAPVLSLAAADPAEVPRVVAGQEVRLASFLRWTDNDPTFEQTANFTWTLSDGGRPITLYGRAANFSFATPGTHEIALTVRDAAGNADVTSFSVHVVTPAGYGAAGALAIGLLAAAFAVAALAFLSARRARTFPRGQRSRQGAHDQGHQRDREEEREDD